MFEQLRADDIFKPKSEEEVIQDILFQFNIIENESGIYDVDGDVDLSYSNLTKLPIKFGCISGNFDCGRNNLISLENAPREVYGYFDCRNNKLTSLKGIGEVKGGIYCDGNLASIEKLMRTVGR